MCNNTVNEEQKIITDLFSQLPEALQDEIIDLMKDMLAGDEKQYIQGTDLSVLCFISYHKQKFRLTNKIKLRIIKADER